MIQEMIQIPKKCYLVYATKQDLCLKSSINHALKVFDKYGLDFINEDLHNLHNLDNEKYHNTRNKQYFLKIIFWLFSRYSDEGAMTARTKNSLLAFLFSPLLLSFQFARSEWKSLCPITCSANSNQVQVDLDLHLSDMVKCR